MASTITYKAEVRFGATRPSTLMLLAFGTGTEAARVLVLRCDAALAGGFWRHACRAPHVPKASAHREKTQGFPTASSGPNQTEAFLKKGGTHALVLPGGILGISTSTPPVLLQTGRPPGTSGQTCRNTPLGEATLPICAGLRVVRFRTGRGIDRTELSCPKHTHAGHMSSAAFLNVNNIARKQTG